MTNTIKWSVGGGAALLLLLGGLAVFYPEKTAEAKKFDVVTSEKALNSSDHCPLVAWLEI